MSESASSSASPDAQHAEAEQQPSCCDRCCTACCKCCCTPKCQLCTILCCFCCLTVCGCRDKVCQRMVFFPPVPFYSFDERLAANGSQTLWLVENNKRIEPYSSANLKMAYVETKRKQTICTMWLRFPQATTTVLFSHGNATDIGCMRDHLIDFARQLKVNVFAYDYTGYGLSSGLPTVADTISDAEAAYAYLLKTYSAESQRVIVYGQSLGSAPTTHLARYKRVSGVVIHSGIMSCLRVLDNTQTSTKWFDVFANVDLMPQVRASVFILHGTEDKEIPIIHGRTLASLPPNAFKPWWVEGAGHNDIEVEFRDAYFAKLEGFVRFVEASTASLEEMEDALVPPPSRRANGASNGSSGSSSSSSSKAPVQLQATSSGTSSSSQPLRKTRGPSASSSSSEALTPLQSPKQHGKQQQQQQQRNGGAPSKRDFDAV